MPDMLVNLLRLPPLDAALTELRRAGVVVRRAQPWELTPVREFVTRNFKRAWADEISAGLVTLSFDSDVPSLVSNNAKVSFGMIQILSG